MRGMLKHVKSLHTVWHQTNHIYFTRASEFIHRWKKTARSSVNCLEHEITAAVIAGVMKIGRQYLCNTDLYNVLNLMGTRHHWYFFTSMVNGTVQMYGYKITRYELKRSICRNIYHNFWTGTLLSFHILYQKRS